MKLPLALVAILLLFLSSRSVGQQPPVAPADLRGRTMVISPATTRPATVGAAEYFSGSVLVTMLFQPVEPSRLSGSSVSFQPGARSAWHSHPLGQRLVVTAGTGWIQQEGDAKREIRAGDVIWTPPDIKHWHGASPTTTMTHITLQEFSDGRNVEWMEKVTDEQYLEGMPISRVTGD